MILNLSDIEVKLDQIIIANANFGREKFTVEIKHKFASLFEATEFGVYANKIGDDPNSYFSYKQEYMYDLAVFEEKQSPRNDVDFVVRTILALESEWSSNFKGVIDDFQKLLVANAMNKVMVFRCHSSELEDYTGFMMQNINEYSGGSGKFFLVAFISDQHKFIVKTV
jgi:hypothetical protein